MSHNATITLDASARSDGVATRLMLAMVNSRLDYCNAALAGLPQSTDRPLQRVHYLIEDNACRRRHSEVEDLLLYQTRNVQ